MMKRERKKQLFALFVLFTFLGSTAAIAVLSAFAPSKEERTRLIYNEPLTNAEEVPFLQKNFVILKYFYSEECVACDDETVDALVQDLGGKIIIEKIDTLLFPEEATTYSVQEVPFYHFKGRSIRKLSGNVSSEELFETACDLFFEPIDQCMIT